MYRFSPRAIFSELRRRRVLNTVALFVVGAWVALQVTELALPGLGIPDSAIRYVWIGAFLMFPLVLIFAWRYDVSTGGIRRTAAMGAAETETSLNRLDHLIITAFAAIALVVIVSMGLRIGQVEPEVSLATVENSIAVMPFEVCEGRARNRDLAAGLTMEVINRLAERGKLKVIARASSHAFAGLGLSKAQIARPLGVQYLLVGEVCRDGQALTLAAELFDKQGFIVWSDRFIREVNQWDQVTERLATLVATGVAAQLGDLAAASPETPVNPRAHEQLLIGEQFWVNGDRQKARVAFVRALEHQPDYAKALFYVAMLDAGDYISAGREEAVVTARPKLEEALTMARRQLETDDRSADNHLMVGDLMQWLTRMDEELAFRWLQAKGLDEKEVEAIKAKLMAGYAESERHLRTAIALNPSLTEAYTLLAEAIERQGVERRTEALNILEDGLVRDPFNLQYNGRIAKRWAGRGRYRQAIELLERFKSLPRIPPAAWWWQLEIMQLQNYWDEKCETLIAMLQNDPGAFENRYNRWQVWWYVGTLADLGLFAEAKAWKERVENMPMEDWMYDGGLYGYLDATGQLKDSPSDADIDPATEQGGISREIEQLEIGRHERAMWHERAVRDDLHLVGLYQLAGRQEDVAALLQLIVARLEQEFAGGVRHWETLHQLSEAYARQGRDEEALAMLRKSYDYHGLSRCPEFEEGMNPPDAAASPWLRFRDEPRYLSLCERIENDRQQQAERIREMLARYDPDDLLAPLMALAEAAAGN